MFQRCVETTFDNCHVSFHWDNLPFVEVPAFLCYSKIAPIVMVEYVLHMGKVPSLKLTYPLKIDPWKRRFLLETIIFRGYVSFREGTGLF